jgi:hypothetical protein
VPKYLNRAAFETQLRIAKASDRRLGFKADEPWSAEATLRARLASGELVIGEPPDEDTHRP